MPKDEGPLDRAQRLLGASRRAVAFTVHVLRGAVEEILPALAA
jgi:hypothetical protein